MRSLLLPVLLALALAQAPAATSLSSTTPSSGDVLVGFEGPLDAALIALHGGSVLRGHPEIGVAHVRAADVAGFTSRLLGSLGVSFVETDDRLWLSGSSPDASSWDASSWDASSWDASSWDASSWDASSWDASSWDASSWDASSWDASSWDASSWDASSWDASSWDASSWDASSWDASSWDWGEIDPGYTSQWGLGAANFPDAWQHTLGRHRIAVCMLDTGVDASHPDLRPSLWRAPDGQYGYNAMLGGGSPADDHGHGTHVAGILGAVGGNGTGVTGAARELVMSVKVMDATGGDESDLVRGLLYCARQGAQIASMSIHIDAPSKAVERAVAHAQAKGMLVIASAGNAGASNVSYPAAYPGVLAVGALTPSGDVAGFSNRGPALDLAAPGYRIASTMRGGGYAVGSGTSQAAPFVAAAAALAWDVAPDLTAAQISGLLTATARDFGPDGFDTTYGHGALDAGAAVGAAAAAAG